MKLIVCFIFIGIFSTGCATYSKQQCIDMDQTEVGYKVGIDGATSFDPAFNNLKINCEQEHGVAVDTQKIKKGWEDGIRFYCTSNGGMRAGSNGITYSGVCSKEDEQKFFTAYNPARMSYLENKVKEQEKTIEVLRNDYESLSSRTHSCESNMSSLEGQLSSAEAKASRCL